MDLTTALGLLALAAIVGTYGTIIGAGGGFVLIPGLILLFDLEGAEAVGTGTIALAVIGLTGAATYDRGGMVARPVAGWFTLGSMPLALLSAWFLADRIDSDVFVSVLGFLLLGLAIFVVVTPPVVEPIGATGVPARPGPLAAGGAVVGVTSGTFAVGGGLLTVPYISRVQHLGPHRAAATTATTAMASSMAASVGHTIAGNVVWSHAVLLIVAAFVGSSVGARTAGRLAPRTVLALLAAGLVAAGIPLLVEAFT